MEVFLCLGELKIKKLRKNPDLFSGLDASQHSGCAFNQTWKGSHHKVHIRYIINVATSALCLYVDLHVCVF